MQEWIYQLLEWIQNQKGQELGYVFLIVLLFILPRLLLRLGIPMALTAFGLGLYSATRFDFYDADNVISIFSTLGIISLFLFAGLEVNLHALKKKSKLLVSHLAFRLVVVAILAFVFGIIFKLETVTAILLALALATPSTGFIFDSIETTDISDSQKEWIKAKAISAELVALGALLFLSQMESTVNLVGSLLIIIILIVVLPFLLKKLARTVEKLVPGSEFSFIFMLAIISGIITKKLGAYYLVGAFLVGMVASQYRRNSPSASADQMLQSLRSFSTFFMPFYFFNSGLNMPSDAFSVEAFKMSLIMFAISVPVKVGSLLVLRRYSLAESWQDSFAITISLMPNLVFGLVLADILKSSMGIPVPVFGGLIIYTLLITMLSPLLLRLIPNSHKWVIVARGAD
jgi:Kef-type K+ transport system membrane component KefB